MPSTVGIVASGVAGFSPLDLSPALWLDASDTSTITESGGAVSQWDNKGSLGNFTQGTGAAQPTTAVSTVNGLNVLDFDGGDTLNAVNQNEWKFLHDGTVWFFSAVWQAGVTANPSTAYGLFGTTTTGAEVGVFVAYDDRSAQARNDRVLASVATGTTNAVTGLTADNFHAANTPVVFSGRFDPANATAASRLLLQVNAGSTSSPNAAITAPSSSNPTRVLQIGALGNNAFSLTGKIAEIIIVSGANATETNRELLRDYLAAKWGL